MREATNEVIHPPESADHGYLPIEHYGVIGDLRTVAMIGVNGSIDWFCYPRIDSPSVFGRLLDAERGGYFQIMPDGDGITWRQQYWPDTNVLITRFFLDGGMVEITDFMPLGTDESDRISDEHSIVRRCEVLRGTVTLNVICQPAFDYGRASHHTRIVEHGAVFTGQDSAGGMRFRLGSTIPLSHDGAGVRGQVTLRQGDEAVFTFQGQEGDGSLPTRLAPGDARTAFLKTVAWWREWLGQCTYTGRWREIVYRSALTLKLLTSQEYGSTVAAPTTSLPEVIGGGANWDYRYAWMRDSAFVIYAFIRLGFTGEAAGFIDWLSARCDTDGPTGPLDLLYRLDGTDMGDEQELGELSGYRDSRPVRIGNAAVDQLQLDIYGEVMDAVYLSNKHQVPISFELWAKVRNMIEWVIDNWQRQDEGIWEPRDGRQPYTMSKVMCWVAIDRALRIANKRSFPCPQARWRQVRDEIYEEVMANAWNEERQAFTQYYGSDRLDASVLLMSLVFFLAPNDPRNVKTIDAILKSPEDGGLTVAGLVYRYPPEDGGTAAVHEEGTFSMCTFWLVEAMTRAGRVDEARLIFERMLGFANHLGLFSEEIGRCGESLGNMPQAFTHFALISAAVNLDKQLGQHQF